MHFENGANVFMRPLRVYSMTDIPNSDVPDENGGTQATFQSDSTSRTDDDWTVIDEVLESDEDENTVFANKQLVDSSYVVDENRIYGRDEHLAEEAKAFKDTLKGERPPDLLLYGASGTGKSVTIKTVATKVEQRCEKRGIRFAPISTNFKHMETHTLDRAVWKLGWQTARTAGVEWDVPAKGVSTDTKYTRLYEIIDDYFDAVVFILDEIDALTGRSDEDEPAFSRLLYGLSRALEEEIIDTPLSVVAITNSPNFTEEFDSRTGSSYTPDEIKFDDYDANQLRQILYRRTDAFRDGCLTDDVIPLAAAFAAQNEGDARKAIDLLRSAGELADDHDSDMVAEKHVREANDAVEKNRSLELIRGMATQKKLSLYAAAVAATQGVTRTAPSPAVYEIYKYICEQIDADVYTQETVNSHVGKGETYGLLDIERTSRGSRTGVYLLFSFYEEPDVVLSIIEEDSRIASVNPDLIRSVADAQVRKYDF
jgi:cell division control protein 6